MPKEKLTIRQISLDEIPPEEIFKDPDIVIGNENPCKEIISYTGKTFSEFFRLVEVIHRTVAPVDCEGTIRLKVSPMGLNIGYVRCRSCNQRLLVDYEELAIQPFIRKMEELSSGDITSVT